MNFIPGFIFLTFYIKIAKSLLSPYEMLDKLKEVKYTPPPQCEAAMRAKWYPETRYYYMYCDEVGNSKARWNIPTDMNSCSGFDCWESQLTYVSKIDILDIFNQYRELVADGTCLEWCPLNKNRLVFELSWNYMAEKAAIQILANCPNEYSDTFADVDWSGTYTGPVLTHLVVTSFELKTGLQREMRLILQELISKNYLKDWGENYQFRRGLMTDVGCAFLLRRDVDFVTARQEVVNSGNVGYLACYFISVQEEQPPAEVMLETNEENCHKVCKSSEFRMPHKNRYLSLCRKSPIYNATFDICNNLTNPYTEEEGGECKNSDEFSPSTWREKFYGLIVRRKENNIEFEAECIVPENPLDSNIVKEGPEIYNYRCTLKHEVFVDANETSCGKENWNCEESQLADVVKISILKTLNVARQIVATGICDKDDVFSSMRCRKGKTFCNIARLEWHWFLEWKAAEKVRNCPVEYSLKKDIQYDDSPFLEPVTFEEVTLVFELPFGEGQLALGRTFKKLFWMNHLRDWNVLRFRRGSALWIGCAILHRANIKLSEETKPELIIATGDGVATHMVCIYAALQNGFFSIRGPANDTKCCPTCDPALYSSLCHTHTVKNLQPYSSLCSSPFLEVTMSCQVQYCKPTENTQVSLAWRRRFEGRTIYQLVDGSFRTFTRNRMNDDLQKMDYVFEKKCCLVLMLSLIMLLTLAFLVLSLIFRYKVEGKNF